MLNAETARPVDMSEPSKLHGVKGKGKIRSRTGHEGPERE